ICVWPQSEQPRDTFCESVYLIAPHCRPGIARNRSRKSSIKSVPRKSGGSTVRPAELTTNLRETGAVGHRPVSNCFFYAVISDSKATRLGTTRVEPLCWIRRCFLKPAKSRLTVSRDV